MKNTKKYFSAGITLAITLFTSAQISAMNRQPTSAEKAEQLLKQKHLLELQQLKRQQPQSTSAAEHMRRTQEEQALKQPELEQRQLLELQQLQICLETQNLQHQELKQLIQISKESANAVKMLFDISKDSTEAMKMLSDKVKVLEQAIKTIQFGMGTLRETVSQNHSTAIRMLNEALRGK